MNATLNGAAPGPLPERRAVSPEAALSRFERDFQAHRRAAHLRQAAVGAAFVLLVAASAHIGEFSLSRLAEGLPKAWNYVERTIPTLRADHLGADLARWFWGADIWLVLLADTVLIGFLATVFGASAALLFSFPAARNLAPGPTSYFVCRRLLEIARTVPELVYAIIFVYAFGLGPLAGVMALAVHSTGSLGKLFSEANENIDPRPLDGVRAAGGSWAKVMRLGALPQVLPNVLSYALLRFEINVRAASVLGIVGAGGIGEELYLAVRQFEYVDISAILLLILIAVSAIDIGSERIRHRLIGSGALDMARA